MDYSFKIFLLIPIISFFVNFLKKDQGNIDIKFSINISKVFALIFLAFLIGISTKEDYQICNLLAFNEYLNLKLQFDKQSIVIAYAISIIWIAILFYVEKSNEIEGRDQEIMYFLKHLPLSIAIITIINCSSTLYPAIFAYSISIFLFLVMLTNNLTIKNVKVKSFYVIFFLSQILILFVTLVVASKYSSIPDGVKILYPLEQSGKEVSFLLFLFTIISLLANFIMPIFYIFRNKVNNESYNIIIGFFINICIAQLLFLKFVAQKFFGIGIFSDFLSNYSMSIIQTTFICSIILSLILLFLTKDLAKMFFLILYNQISLNLLLIFIDFAQDGLMNTNLIFTFIIFTILLFMVFNNLRICRDRLKIPDLIGSFSHLKVNISMLIFCFLSLSSLFPFTAPNLINMISLTQGLEFNTATLIVVLNSIALLIIGLRIIIPSFQVSEENLKDINIQQEAQRIDLSSQLTLTPIVAIVTILISFFII